MTPRLFVLCGTAALLLGGCESVSLDQPAPIVSRDRTPAATASAPVRPPAAPPLATPAASVPQAEAQPLAPPESIQALPLAPAGSAPASPASAPAPMAPAASAAAPAVAPAPAASAAAAASTLYVCGDRSAFRASFGDVSVTLTTALGVMQLQQTEAADGARYRNGELEVWFKGREATISNLDHPGSTLLCIEQR